MDMGWTCMDMGGWRWGQQRCGLLVTTTTTNTTSPPLSSPPPPAATPRVSTTSRSLLRAARVLWRNLWSTTPAPPTTTVRQQAGERGPNTETLRMKLSIASIAEVICHPPNAVVMHTTMRAQTNLLSTHTKRKQNTNGYTQSSSGSSDITLWLALTG